MGIIKHYDSHKFLQGVFYLALLMLMSSNVQAQLIIDFSPKASRFPQELISFEQFSLASTDVSDQFQFDINESSVAYTDDTVALDLTYVYFSRTKRVLTYEGFESGTPVITTGDSYLITKDDLPRELSKDFGYIGIPVWIGESRFNLFYGQLTLTDNKEVNEEDVVRFLDVEYYLTPEADSTWLVGWYYADAFDEIYNVPFLGFISGTNDILAINLVIPVAWSVDTAFGNGWVLGIGQQVEGEAYRLTEEEPWNSAILSFSGIKSIATIGYHFNSGWYVKVEGGTIAQQKIHFYKDTISVSSLELSEEAYLSDDVPLMELTLKDTSFVAVSLAWAF